MIADDFSLDASGTEQRHEERRCVACGYDLRGSGDEPRCPECGLLNIPAGYRQQVWDLVDSGRWFFSGFFAPFRKRLPGWWWALDRERDVRRSFRAVLRNVVVVALIVTVCGALGDAVEVEVSERDIYTDASGANIECGGFAHASRLLGRSAWYEHDFCYRHPDSKTQARFVSHGRVAESSVKFDPSWGFVEPCVGIVLWAILVWAIPTTIGLLSQVRRNLPAFARAPRTILAAANYESHRMVFFAAAVGIWMIAERMLSVQSPEGGSEVCRVLGLYAITVYGGVGWIGGLRSDYTHQLIRSPFHAGRIIIMYALLLPWLGTIAVLSVPPLVSGWN